ncbi:MULTISPECIES: formate dehydrogenase subunit gamma [Methylobacterium]|uniref:formate dehydrogenase subunit gamma n=1 Tax=Methylobacterium TaxID=407 RepID=UPI0008E717D6|nr:MULTISPECIES: formate dehydrogenase subunit gamma [Methylobacterium]MBZ6411880.1 formate dehydrogenase subunit gamma [Methylobacterium sp.]MBK3398187.1 formate dehydrogenase subunit gamma [Methylobacterium ajmalii]MBK3407477.1 formate dehydrogenase subunit gamma [Methylobacterium ajmalii]MBK3425788.1 formate dehydrogenase subunit gamma [Methylobacterium ajmalii]SFF18124.1 formate dehydrogenase subunit gamma [Methylobacterium sp. yr596]
MRRLTSIALLTATLALAAPALAQVRAPDGAPNPTASSVNEEMLFKQDPKIHGRISIPNATAANLIQPQGREWRAFRESWMPWIGALAVLGMIAALGLFYFTRGRIRLEHSEESGKKILRFNGFERFSHWMTASCFIVLSLSGLNYIFGKRLLMPLIGPEAFASLAQYGKYAHIYLAWPFMLGVLFMLVLWVRDNIPGKIDWIWLKQGGGLIGDAHPSAGRFNAGQKMVFWMVVGFGLAMSATGLMMIFPFAVTDINGMQAMQVIHSLIGVVFIAGILAHIYIGSLGMEGAYDAMGSGEVDLAWAKVHHDLWVKEQQAKTASGPQLGRGQVPAE